MPITVEGDTAVREPNFAPPPAVKPPTNVAEMAEPEQATRIRDDVMAKPENAESWGGILDTLESENGFFSKALEARTEPGWDDVRASVRATGGVAHMISAITARSSDAEAKMESLGLLLSGLDAEQKTKVLGEMSANPTGADQNQIVARIRAETATEEAKDPELMGDN